MCGTTGKVNNRLAASAEIGSKNDDVDPEDFIPAVPVVSNLGGLHGGNKCHRDKFQGQSEVMCHNFSNALVARPVGQKEINNIPAAQTAPDKEWNNLTSKGAWAYSSVKERRDVSKEAIKSIKNKTKVHVGKLFEICVEKGREKLLRDPMCKFKGRRAFQGNNVIALFADLGSSPASMEAWKTWGAYGAMAGNKTRQGDGKQTYTQALMQGILTWIGRLDWSIQRPGCTSYVGFTWAP